MNVCIFGPNLKDQSKGLFIVHEASCRDCSKLRGEEMHMVEVRNKKDVAEFMYGDDYQETSLEMRLTEFHFEPCIHGLPIS